MPSWEPAPRPTASKLQGITSAKVQYLEIFHPIFNCGVSKMSEGAWYFGTLILGTLV